MKITRRPAVDGDKPWLRDTHHETYHDLIAARWGRFDLEKANGYFEKTWTASGIEVLVCDDKPCGFAVIEKHPDHIRIGEIALRPAFQGQGIGTAVLRAVFDDAGKKGVPVKLRVMPQNKALSLYKRLGFRECGKDETHVLMEYTPD